VTLLVAVRLRGTVWVLISTGNTLWDNRFHDRRFGGILYFLTLQHVSIGALTRVG